MKWKTISGDKQIDEVGNVFQRSGAVEPKACQKCKKKFKSSIQSIPVIEPISFYKCKTCDFETPNSEQALDHKLLTEKHKLHKTQKERIVRFEKTLTGIISHITKTKDDVIILCGVCNGS